jgi:hypothetical protein
MELTGSLPGSHTEQRSEAASSSYQRSGGTPYEILVQHATLLADVPVGEHDGTVMELPRGPMPRARPDKSDKPKPSDTPPRPAPAATSDQPKPSDTSGPSDKSELPDDPATTLAILESQTHRMLEDDNYEATKYVLETWLDLHGIEAVPNAGDGRSSCLVISLIQLASGNRAHPASELVAELKQTLSQHGVGDNDALLPTDPAAVALVNEVNRRYGCQLRLVFVQAFADHDPPYALLEAETAGTPAVIWDKLGHFEALVTKRS